ncbi:MAG: ABC transporter ATP-binding protein, partial [Planctomycetota bacterium]
WRDNGEIANFAVESEKGTDVREEIFSSVVKNNGIIREMTLAPITLEEVFHQITTQEQEVTA